MQKDSLLSKFGEIFVNLNLWEDLSFVDSKIEILLY